VLQPLVVHGPAFQPESPVHKSPTPAHMTPGQLADAAKQLLLLNCRHRYRPALGVAVLAGQPTGTALGYPESILQNIHGSAASLRAQKFPSVNSLSIALSSSASARRRLRRAFSCSCAFRRLASVSYGLRPTASTSRRRAAASGDRSEPTPQGPTNVSDVLALVEELLSGTQLADDLLRSVALTFHGASPGQVWPLGSSHKDWFSYWGPRQPVLAAVGTEFIGV